MAHPVLAWVDTKAMGWPEMRFALWGCQRGAPRVGVLPKFLGEELASLWYYVLASAEDRATQACDPSAALVAIQRERLGLDPGLFLSRWQPQGDKRTSRSSGLASRSISTHVRTG